MALTLLFELMSAGAVHPKADSEASADLVYELVGQSGAPTAIIEGPGGKALCRLDEPTFEKLQVLLLTQDPIALTDALHL